METIVITGATSGIGLETARLLAKRGYRIIGVGRTEESCGRGEGSILGSVPGAHVRFFAADLMQRNEVIRLAGLIRRDLEENCGGSLRALINNAGCARSRYMTTPEGYEQLFALNYLAAFLLTNELLPALVIMTGSRSHMGAKVCWGDVMLSRRYGPLKAYKQSKLCCVLFAQSLNERCGSYGIRAYTVDPGLVNTDIGSKAGGVVRAVWNVRKRGGAQPSVPAETFARLCGARAHPRGLNHREGGEAPVSRRVTKENADRLFALSEKLCGIKFGEAAA